jgi:DNA-binding NarL/FixJ family response regulator
METKAEIRVVIADDHPVFRQGLRQVVEAEPSLRVVAEAGDGEAALARLREARPDVALVDLDMPGMSGFEVARAVRRENLPVELVFLTMHKDEDVLEEALRLGVKGYVVKDSAVTDIVGSVRAVAAGRHFISPSVSAHLVRRRERAADLARRKPGLEDLTPAELRVLRLIAEHKTSREIAAELYVSHRTIENHRANICQKLGLRGSHALLRFALEHKSELL